MKIVRIFLKYLTVLGIILSTLGILPPHAFSQPTMTDTALELTLDPEIPRAYEEVKIQAQSYSFNIDQSDIGWYIDNKLISRGIGQRTFSFTTGDYGQEMLLTVIAVNKGREVRKSLVIAPQDVDIAWNAGTYVPPFYKGKKLVTDEADVTFVALPQVYSKGKLVPPENLLYTWSKDGEIIGDASGYGRQSMLLPGSFISRPYTIYVDVKTTDSSAKASGFIQMNMSGAVTALYENNPLYGYEFGRALTGALTMSGEELSIGAFPYFTSTGGADDSRLHYSWTLDGRTLENIRSSVITLKKNENTTDSTTLSVQTSNDTKLLQSAGASFDLSFTQ